MMSVVKYYYILMLVHKKFNVFSQHLEFINRLVLSYKIYILKYHVEVVCVYICLIYFSGLKQHLTPILAGLLESNEKKKWNFNTLFNEVEKIDEKIIIHVFCPHKWSLLRIYIKPEAS